MAIGEALRDNSLEWFDRMSSKEFLSPAQSPNSSKSHPHTRQKIVNEERIRTII
jgi:hypothetical protein